MSEISYASHWVFMEQSTGRISSAFVERSESYMNSEAIVKADLNERCPDHPRAIGTPVLEEWGPRRAYAMK